MSFKYLRNFVSTVGYELKHAENSIFKFVDRLDIMQETTQKQCLK